jgi:outer membrane lipoprotein-sorting protein
MRLAALGALIAALAAQLCAEEPPAREPMERKAAEEFLAGVVEARRGVKTITATFAETKESVVLLGESRSRGVLRVVRPDSVRRDVVHPSRSAIILVGARGWLCVPGTKDVAFDLSKGRGQNVAGVILGLLVAESFELAELEKRFHVAAFAAAGLPAIGSAAAGELVLELKPSEKELAERLPVIRIFFPPKAVWPRRVEWETAEGDRLADEFTVETSGGEIPPGVFSPPVDWEEKLPACTPKPAASSAGAAAPAAAAGPAGEGREPAKEAPAPAPVPVSPGGRAD